MKTNYGVLNGTLYVFNTKSTAIQFFREMISLGNNESGCKKILNDLTTKSIGTDEITEKVNKVVFVGTDSNIVVNINAVLIKTAIQNVKKGKI